MPDKVIPMYRYASQATQKTRGPKGYCRSPEYNERVKNLTSELNQK